MDKTITITKTYF